MALMFETQRLVMAEAAEDDVDGLLAVALTNPDFTGDHEGSDGEPGRFDRDILERDLVVAWMDPARHPLVLRSKGEPGRSSGGPRSLMSIHVIVSPGLGCWKCTSRSSATATGGKP